MPQPVVMLTKTPKYPTRLEESMLRRKRGGYVCTCFDEDVEDAHFARMHSDRYANADDVRREREAEAQAAMGKDDKDDKKAADLHGKIRARSAQRDNLRKGDRVPARGFTSRPINRISAGMPLIPRVVMPQPGRSSTASPHHFAPRANKGLAGYVTGTQRGSQHGGSQNLSVRSNFPGSTMQGRPAAMVPGARRVNTPLRLGPLGPPGNRGTLGLPPRAHQTQTPGLTIPIQSVLSSQLDQAPLALFNKNDNKNTGRRCSRLHVMYKTPQQVLQEMDEERDRMVLMAEITDLIERKLCKLKDKKKKKIPKKPDKLPKPCWYQELTTTQMNSVEMLGCALMADMEEGIMDRTVILIKSLGLKPPPSTHIIWHVMVNCYTSPVLFILYLAKCLEPRKRPSDKNLECMYAVRERILLSCFAHLLMPRTLFDLHFLLPQPKILNKLQRKAPVSFRLRKKYYCTPYCEPQPVFVKKYLDEIEENKYELIEKLEEKKKLVVPTNEEFYDKCIAQEFDDRTQYIKTVDKYFNRVKCHYKVLAKRSRIQLERQYGAANDEENCFYRQASFLPTLDPTFPNQTYNFLRYATSTEPPETSILPQIQENQDHEGFEPMMSFRECLYTWDDYPLSEVCGSHIPPVTDINVFSGTSMMQMLTLEGYWHAYPRPTYCRKAKYSSCTTQDPYSSFGYMKYLKQCMEYLASKGNPLAALPDSHLLPHIHKWILQRNRFTLTEYKKQKLKEESNEQFERGRYKMKLQPLPWIKIPLKKLHNLTWDSRCLLERKVKKEKKKFYGRLQTWMVNDTRKFWDIMFTQYHDAPFFRDAFYAYCPSTQTDVLFPCKIVRK